MLLNLRYERFVAEYLKDLNGTRACIRAGYAAKGARQQSSRLLALPEVRDAIAARQRQLAEQFEVTEQRVIAEFAKLAFANLDDFIEVPADGIARVELAKADRTRRAALTQVVVEEYENRSGSGERARRVRIKIASKQHALDSLARYLGLFIDRSEVTITDNLGDDLAAARKRAWG
ncbi:MAG: terminase small subunit [Reyranellaceae bacterium]